MACCLHTIIGLIEVRVISQQPLFENCVPICDSLGREMIIDPGSNYGLGLPL